MFSNTNEVDTLGNPKERGYDKGSAACSFHEGRWSLLNPEFPREKEESCELNEQKHTKQRSVTSSPLTFVHLFFESTCHFLQECGSHASPIMCMQFGY